jgi:hypothetical protein
MQTIKLTNNYINPISSSVLFEQHLFLPNDSVDLEVYVDSLVSSCIADFNRETSRELFVQTFQIKYDTIPFVDGVVSVPLANIVELTSITVENMVNNVLTNVSLDVTKFRLVKGKEVSKLILLDSTYPIEEPYYSDIENTGGFNITVTAGLFNILSNLNAFPSDIKHALLSLIAFKLENRGDEQDMRATNEGLKFAPKLAYPANVMNVFSTYKKHRIVY